MIPARTIPGALAGLFWVLSLAAQAAAQSATSTYTYPLPNTNGGLSGTFGEMRHTHFHAGLDIRTEGRIGLRVVAARRGYIYRIHIRTNGYGKALYIRHPDKSVTVYGHIDRLAPGFERIVRKQQREDKRFAQQLFFDPGELPVSRGQLIAYSGNTGSSGGPHLHFEIRDPEENTTNPMRFFTDVIRDTEKPFISRIAFQPLNIQSRVNGHFGKHVLYPAKRRGHYFADELIRVNGPVGLEFTAYDRIPNSTTYLGAYAADVYLDGERIYSYRMDTLAFGDSKYMYRHLDYAYLQQHTSWLQKAYVQSGNKLPIYHSLRNNGRIQLKDDRTHRLKLVVSDYHGNQSSFIAKLKRAPRNAGVQPLGWEARPHKDYDIRGNVLRIESQAPASASSDSLTLVYGNGQNKRVPMTYSWGGKAYTLVKLSPGKVPNRVLHPRWAKPLAIGTTSAVLPGREHSIIREDGVRLYFPAGAVFDTTYFGIERTDWDPGYLASPVYTFGNENIPLKKDFTFYIPPDEQMAKRFPEEKLVMVRYRGNGRYSRVSPTRRGSFSTDDFGRYGWIADTEPPKAWLESSARLRAASADRLELKLYDKIADVDPATIELTWDGEWRIPEFYSYQHLVILRFGDPPGKGWHRVKLRAEDHAGNRVVKSFRVRVY